jgi:hypothetical protein
MFASNWDSSKPDLSYYESVRKTPNPNSDSYMDESSNIRSENNTFTADEPETVPETNPHFKSFMEQVKSANLTNAEKNDQYFPNLHVKYRRPLTLADIEKLFGSLALNKKLCKKSKRNWSEEEIQLLIYFVRQYSQMNNVTPLVMSEDDWEEIAKLLPRRLADCCKEKWMSLHHIHIHDAPWTNEEDAILVELIHKYGLKKWTLIARELNKKACQSSKVFRQGKQCRERWINHLDPSINKGAWTSEEDVKLLSAVVKLGKKWSEISKMLVNRTENSVKNRWKSLLKKYRAEHVLNDSRMSPEGERIITTRVLHEVQNGLNAETRPRKEEHAAPENLDWLLDNIDEDCEANMIPESLAKSQKRIAATPNIHEEINIKFLNNYLNTPAMKNQRFDFELENSFSQLKLETKLEDNMSTKPSNQCLCSNDVQIQTINELSDLKEVENLEICLFNGTNKVVYKATDILQKKMLNSFILSMIQLDEAKKDTFASLLTLKQQEIPQPKFMMPHEIQNPITLAHLAQQSCGKVDPNAGNQFFTGGNLLRSNSNSVRNPADSYMQDFNLSFEKASEAPILNQLQECDSPVSRMIRGATAFFN